MARARDAEPIVKAASTLDYRELARRRLPKFLFEYIAGGSYAELTQLYVIRDRGFMRDLLAQARRSTVLSAQTRDGGF